MTTAMRRYDLLIFDWDGTLMDSAGEIVAAMQEAIRDIGLPARSDDQLRDLIGLGLHDSVARLFPDLAPEQVSRWLLAYRQRYTAPHRQSLLFEPVRDTLAQLARDGHDMAVATGKSRRGLDRVLAQVDIGDYFRCTRCADETRPKPAPDMVEDILLRTATQPARALVVGDTEYDMVMARDAGVDAVGVACGVHDAGRLHAAGALTVLDSVGSLPDWLARSAGAVRV